MDLWDLQIITFCFDLHFTRSGKVCPYFPAEETSCCCSSVLVLIKKVSQGITVCLWGCTAKTCQCAHNDCDNNEHQKWTIEQRRKMACSDESCLLFSRGWPGACHVFRKHSLMLWKPRVLPPMWILLWYYCRRQISTLYLDLQLISCLVCNS